MCIRDRNDTGIFSNLAPATEYTFVTRMKYNPDEAMESRQSEGLAVKTKAASAPAPAAPDWSERSETSILLEAVENQEYAVKKADGSWTWQASPEFTGLNPNKMCIRDRDNILAQVNFTGHFNQGIFRWIADSLSVNNGRIIGKNGIIKQISVKLVPDIDVVRSEDLTIHVNILNRHFILGQRPRLIRCV